MGMAWARWGCFGVLVAAAGFVSPAAAQTCANPWVLPCNVTTGLLNTDLQNDEDTYSCTGTTMQGAQDEFVMNEPAGTEIFLAMVPANFTGGAPANRPNVDMIVVEDSCASGPCVSYSQQPNGIVEWALDPNNDGSPDGGFVSDGGDYFVHVDVDQAVGGWPYILDSYCNFCDPATDVAREITCSSDLLGETAAAGTSSMNFYTCGTPYAPLLQVNTENIYAFVPQGDGNVTFSLTNMTSDHDIYVLQDQCNEASCIDGATDASVATDQVTFFANAGTTYYIVVENFDGQGGSFDLGFIDNTGGCLEDCDDGIDNDNDGFIDCADSDCFGDPLCVNVETICDDNIDNDGDGPVDCLDSDCFGNPACVVEDCCNGVDDDGDGRTDVFDSECPDGDGDLTSDSCDICPGFDDNIDSDGDSTPDGCDN